MPIAASTLLTDLYQFTMLQTYHAEGMNEPAVFELFSRRLPPERGFLIAAGLEQALDFLGNLRFTAAELDWLTDCGRFRPEFVAALEDFRFTGAVDALPEGTAFFANQPVLRVIAPLPQAQLVESRLINLIHFQTLIASKAARCVLAAPDQLLVTSGCVALTEQKQHCWRRGPIIWPASRAPPPYWPGCSLAFRCLAQWPIR